MRHYMQRPGSLYPHEIKIYRQFFDLSKTSLDNVIKICQILKKFYFCPNGVKRWSCGERLTFNDKIAIIHVLLSKELIENPEIDFHDLKPSFQQSSWWRGDFCYPEEIKGKVIDWYFPPSLLEWGIEQLMLEINSAVDKNERHSKCCIIIDKLKLKVIR